MNHSDEAYEQITGFKPNPKPFSDRTEQERQEAFQRFLTALEDLPDDDTVRNFMKERPMNRIPEPGSTLFIDDGETHAA